MTWTHYIIMPTGEPQDFKVARGLVQGDDDAEWYVDSMINVLQGHPDPDDGIESIIMGGGVPGWLAEDHHGVGDGGAQWIGNTEWFATAYPHAFKALGVQVSWSKGKSVFFGRPDGTK